MMKLAGYLLLIVPSALINAWALTTVWAWFLVPWGLPALTTPAAIGMAAVASLLRPAKPVTDRPFIEDAVRILLSAPLLVLLIWPLYLLFGVR